MKVTDNSRKNKNYACVIKLDNYEAHALAVLLGGINDESEHKPLESLYNKLAEAGWDFDGPMVEVQVEDNPDYDPEDEDDKPVFISLVNTDEA